MPEPFRSILHHYNTQAYDACLAGIEKALQTKLVEGQRATLLMTKAMCEEELGREAAAKDTLALVKTQFEHTRFADAAQRRLDGKDGDQREHLELNLDDPRWRRALKQCNEKGVRQYFFPVGENPRQCTSKLLVFSMDRPDNMRTLEDAINRADAEFSLRGGTAKPKLLERTTNEEYWEVEESSPNQKWPSISLSRVILTDNRFHCVEFTLRKAALSRDEREKYLGQLKRATLAGGK